MLGKLIRLALVLVFLAGCGPRIQPPVEPTATEMPDLEINSVAELVERFNGKQITVKIIYADMTAESWPEWEIIQDGQAYTYRPWSNSDYSEGFIDTWIGGRIDSTGMMPNGTEVRGTLYAWPNGYGLYPDGGYYYYDLIITDLPTDSWERVESFFATTYLSDNDIEAFRPDAAPDYLYYSPKEKLEFACKFDLASINPIADLCPSFGDWFTPGTVVSYGYATEIGVIEPGGKYGDVEIVATRVFTGEIMNQGFPWEQNYGHYMEVEYQSDGQIWQTVMPVGSLIAIYGDDYIGWRLTDLPFGVFTNESIRQFCVGGCG